MKATGILLAVLCLSLCLVRDADAQIWRWFGPKTPDKKSPGKSTPDPRRATEIDVEIAWLADPITFPYYLEAHANATELEVRGYVPNRAVREQAVRIAQVHSSLKVVDSLKEHPSLLVKPGQLSAQQLQSTAQSALRVALPKQCQQLKVEAGPDGKVFVLGPVNSIEEKALVSQALRRLHGCTSVQNLTTPASETAKANASDKLPIVKTSNPPQPVEKPTVDAKPAASPDTKSKSWFAWLVGKNGAASTNEPPLAEPKKPVDKAPPPAPIMDPRKLGDPVEAAMPPRLPEPRNLPAVVKEQSPPLPAKPKEDGPVKQEPPLPPPRPEPPPLPPTRPEPPPLPTKVPELSVAQLQKRIQAACPDAKNIEVQFTSATEVRISLEIRTEKDLEPTAERLFAMPELQNYRPDLQFKISSP